MEFSLTFAKEERGDKRRLLDMDEKLRLLIQERARSSPKAELVGGKCSLCGRALKKKANFCFNCGATFLTEKQIEEADFNIK